MDGTTVNEAAKVSLRPGIAERLWEASRIEFSLRGYHGARVQGIARRAGCNVALLYRHWSSKKALYLDVLRTVWQGISREAIGVFSKGSGPEAVVRAYLDANMRDPLGAQIMIREFLDGGPFLSQLVATDPTLTDPIRSAERIMAGAGGAGGLRPGLDATVTVLAICGLTALIASAHEASRPLFSQPASAETWRSQVYELLLHGVLGGAPSQGDAPKP